MPRVVNVKHARKDQGKCGKCGEPIKVRDPYRHWSFRFGGKHKRCMKASCNPRRSDMTSSDKLGQLYRAQEDAEDMVTGAGAIEDYAVALENAASVAEEVSEMYEESAQTLEGAFTGGSPKIDELREYSEACSDWAERLNQAASDIRELEEPVDDDTGDEEQEVEDDSDKPDPFEEARSIFDEAINELTI